MFGCDVVRHALVTEVSVLTTSKPAEPGARVLTVHPKRAMRVAAPLDRPLVLIRPGIGQVLGVR